MEKNSSLTNIVKTGFKTLDIPEKYINSAIKGIDIWLTNNIFKEYVPQIKFLIKTKKWELLLDSFYKVISFGTGGRRGHVGIGPNRINKWTIQASAQGHSQYLIKQYGNNAKSIGIVLAYDVRKYTEKGIYDETIFNPVMDLTCKQLSDAAAEVYAANKIRVFMFDGARSTPELSFAIPFLNCMSGAMFSASHNLPTDNGKKVYDNFGGQLIPPHDQFLVEEVTKNVNKIETISLNEAKNTGFLTYIGKEVDKKYHDAVSAISLSDKRDIKILYSPLHGTGITSVYPILKSLGFDIVCDPDTSFFSGAFENVIYNIPNPEVVESFETLMPEADKVKADIILSTDPDADRIGVMVKHQNQWAFLNGNEIGIILTVYGINKYKEAGRLKNSSLIIKTGVTTSLIQKIAIDNNISIISDLLVGFKYIGEEMNVLESKNRIEDLILGTEESHGYIIGDYCRDKDAAGAAVWISELCAELKVKNMTLMDYLNNIYAEYGYCHNYLTEIRLLGVKGMEQILLIMEHLRKNKIKTIGDFVMEKKIDRWDGEPAPHLSKTDTSARNILIFKIKNKENTHSLKITVRPSGTEPKIKMYFEIIGHPFNIKEISEKKQDITNIRLSLEKSFMRYCYKILNIEFPDRGFLLFWQLPLNSKLKYFEIEDKIAALKNINDKKEKRKKLNQMLKFLGANPVKKVDNTFCAKFGTKIYKYLNI